ncbi:sodium channel protein Nach [Bicyclus anynana]|uniref:Sodium channel protein Nach n=1 Tax=Bicyclus anynana TaxID=110368 RepID=A0ABM3LYN0_BICAN|nr:sodium channel protein Nach [Bicyclus anynana]
MKDNNQSVWWREYRRRLYKPNPRNMSIETVLRINFRKTFSEYKEHCSLTGLQRIWKQNQGFKQRIIRTLLFLSMLGIIGYFFQNLWFENLARPLIVTMESSTYPISNIEFPAVTLCNFNRINKSAMEKWSKLAPQCNELLVRCAWAGEIVECSDIFTVQRTVHGHCCAFNLVVGNFSGGIGRSIDMIKRQYQPGQLQGLNVVLDSKIEDYAYSTFNMFGFEVLIYDATHYADPTGGNIIQRIIQPDQFALFEINTVKQVATKEVRKYPPKTRKCFFHDEMKEEFKDFYSYSACIVMCRIKTLKSLCKCVPYYFPIATQDAPVCSIDHLKCLNRYKDKLFYLFPEGAENTQGLEAELQDALYCPQCLPDCELTRHYSRHSKIPLSYFVNQNKEYTSFFFDGLNMSGKCLLSIYQPTTDGVLNRLDVVLYWFEVVSNVGGFCGILIGFSMISVLEFVYFFVFRFFWNLYTLYY